MYNHLLLKEYIILFQSVFRYALDSRIIKENPCCGGVILPKKEYNAQQRRAYLDENQAKKLLEMLDEKGNCQFQQSLKHYYLRE